MPEGDFPLFPLGIVALPGEMVGTLPASLPSGEIAFAGGNPEFAYSDQATINEDAGMPLVNGATGDTVLPIVDDAGAAAAPVRSFFQTYSGGIRSVWDASWAKLRAGAVQTITGVAW